MIFLVASLSSCNAILAQNENQPSIGFDNASYSTKKMTCDFYNTGKISAQDQEQTKVTVTVTDPNANKFNTSIDRVTVHVWSDSDQKGVEITAYETNVNSGIFKGTITISDGQTTQDAIHVSEGDTLSARYPSTIPWSVNAANHGIVTTAFIGMSCPPFERVPASSIRILDNMGNNHNVIAVDQQVMITSDIVNPTTTNQNFTYIVQIQDKNGSTASLAWLSGTMLSKQAFSPSVSWTPSKVGNYVVNAFVWESLVNPNALSPPLYADLTVLHSSSIYEKSITGNVENLHCKLGFDLVIKPSNNSPACVTPSTAQKLVERGWSKEISHTTSTNSTSQTQNPFSVDNNGKVDLSKIHLARNQYGQIDYEKIGHMVSENQFKKMLDEMNIPYAQDDLLLQDGMSLLTLPPFTDYCGYVKDNNTQEHWFSSNFHNDTLTNYKVYATNPKPCKPGPPFDCFCSLQIRIAEKNLKELSYFTASEENTVGNALSEYFDGGKVVNVSNEFVVGKYNLDTDPYMIHYCGKFTWGASLTYFEGYMKNSTVVDLTLASEKQKLCAIPSDAKLFSFNESANGIRK